MDLSSIFRFSDMVEYFPKILSRFPVTLLIVVVSVAGGLVLGFILAAARIFKIPVLTGSSLYLFCKRYPDPGAAICSLLWTATSCSTLRSGY